ncbi:Dimethylglycine oxidase 1 [Colletotrichum chlorophyti]|uniref:Dimethylglycine oxidase 1 n=1 Tax=Colletotrichum chlorophyti TaxID=708187 RepID=A0A1Q8RSC8_9PEZI|nr:Dimethylglycine oxidase 1 [Colletotrichum chlorophyti]
MSKPTETVIIVGAGIVGSALAYFLSLSPTPRTITIIDRSFGPLLGSTGHAPGYVGQFNESDVLTRLAIDTVSEYTKIPGGFDTVGGLEVALKHDGVERLHARCASAKQLGLEAEMLSIEQARVLAPELVNNSSSGAAVFFPTDGTADACKITTFYQEKAKSLGVNFVQGGAEKLVVLGDRISGVEILDGNSARHLSADKIILTTGIWAQDMCRGLNFPIPVIPVGHPYMYGQARSPPTRRLPFVRWPEHHVYARDHGEKYGIGTYNHPPVGCSPANNTAIGHWIQSFEQPLKLATDLLPSATADQFEHGESFNGIFSMTPDNMPFAGAVHEVEGLYMAVAIWVTHAAGTAKFMAKLVDGLDVDEKARGALDPERFRGQSFAALEEKSLLGYNSIYKTVSK